MLNFMIGWTSYFASLLAMAVANTKSTAITNMDASPTVRNSSYIADGVVRSAVGTVEVAAADDDNSVYRFVRIPAAARIVDIQLWNDAITGGTAYHVGLHETLANGGAAKDADLFATSVDCSSARVTPLSVLFEVLNIDKIEKRVWDLLAITEGASGSRRDYDVTMTGATAGTAAGTLTLQVLYTI